ncbi:efflux RND transporter permease subunit [Ancylomarina sp. DW003]|nr:efflux RND transporter permease subunit [Ancylomarina sp. DW003]MDE5423541.1 efflux RND transporter permease subunit [Ancylomarina sp. DW003]
MRALITYFIKYPFAGNLLAVVFFLLGWIGISQLNSTVMPQIDPGVITITASYPGASPEEVEKGVSLKIEDNLKGISGVDKITSSSKENTVSIKVSLESGYDGNLALQDVKNAVDGISSFPVGVESISVKKNEFEILALDMTLNGDLSLKTLKTYARQIENDLRGIDGISKVSLSGFPDEEIEISINEEALKAYNLTFDEIYTAVANENIELTGGSIKGEDEELKIRIREKDYYAEQLKDIVIRSKKEGGTIRLMDVCQIKDKWSETPNRAYVDGKPAISISVRHTSREDILSISENLHAYAKTFNAKHDAVSLDVLFDNSSSVRVMLDILLSNGLMGFMLVLLFLSLFLNHRLSFWVALGIPISFMGMFMVAAAYGVTLNKISLFGMILVVGILVDDGIVICENIFQHYERGKSALQAAIDGTMEVMPAVFSAVLTTIVAFTAFFFIEGRLGQFFVELAFVVIFALIFSLVEAFFILPSHVMHSKALKRDKKVSKLEQTTTNAVLWVRRKGFEPISRFSINNKTITAAIAFGVLALTFGALTGGIIISGDSSIDDTNYTNVELEMPAGTPESETLKYLTFIEEAAIKTGKEFQDKSLTGEPVILNIKTDLTSTSVGKITVYIIGSEKRDFLSGEFSNAISKNVGDIPQAERLNFVQESHFGKPISVSLQSSNLDDLNLAKEELKSTLSKIEGLKNVIDNDQLGMREVKLSLKDNAYKLGLNLNAVTAQVRTGFYGKEVQRLQRGIDEVRVWVRYEKSERSSIGQLENMRIRTAAGGEYFLKDIANISFERNLVKINHLNGQREISIEADVTGANVNLGQINSELNENILPALESKYPGLKHRYQGKTEEMAKAGKSAILIAPVFLILIFSIVIFTFKSVSQTILIFTLIPFGFIGVGWGHWLHGIPLDISSYLGMVALMGVMVNDSIVLISTLNEKLKSGEEYLSAIYDTAVSRFRPIVLTSITTIVGLAPLIVSNDPEAGMVIPMAVSMAYGMAVATFLNLLLLPVLLIVVNSLRCRWQYLRTGVMPSRESVEPAVKNGKEFALELSK